MSRGSKPVSSSGGKPKAKPADRPKARAAAARPSRGPGRGRSSAAGTRGSSSPAGKKAAARKAATRAAEPAARATKRAGAARPTSRGADRGAPPARPPKSKAERGLGGDQVEGRQAVRELLLAGTRKVVEVWVASDQDDAVLIDDIAELAQDLGVPVRDVSRPKLLAQARTEAPQGVLAKARDLPETDLDDLVAPRKKGTAPFLLAVDGVTDPGNLGALLRSAECAGVTGVVLPRHRAVHITPTVTKAAAGAIEYLPMAVVGGLPATITRLQEQGVWVVGLDMDGDSTLFDFALADEPVMLVLGAEGKGLSRLVRARCDAIASIPISGRLGSLNVAAAGALACFEVARRRELSARAAAAG